ncbi:MAG: PEGA domain-containing protein, partial [Myxococcota bacterium]
RALFAKDILQDQQYLHNQLQQTANLIPPKQSVSSTTHPITPLPYAQHQTLPTYQSQASTKDSSEYLQSITNLASTPQPPSSTHAQHTPPALPQLQVAHTPHPLSAPPLQTTPYTSPSPPTHTPTPQQTHPFYQNQTSTPTQHTALSIAPLHSKTLLRLALFSALFLIVAFIAVLLIPTQMLTGVSLHVQTSPKHVNIQIDQQNLGQTPRTIFLRRAHKSYTITLKAPGYTPYKRTLQLQSASSKPLPFYVRLAPKAQTAFLSIPKTNGNILLDGYPTYSSALKKYPIPAGKVRISVVFPNQKVWKRSIHLRPKQHRILQPKQP